MSGNAKPEASVSEYQETAYRAEAIPKQKPLEDPGGFAKALEGGDLIERLSWGSYAYLNIQLGPNSASIHQKRAQGLGNKKLAGPPWTHRHSPTDLIKTRWQLLLMLAGSFADYAMLKWMLSLVFFTAVIVSFKFGTDGFFKTFNIGIAIFAIHLFFRHPFFWFYERNVHRIITDLGCGFYRPTGMLRIRKWGNETFEAPFIEFDPYISFHVQPKGPTSYKLQLRHRYTGWQTALTSVHTTRKHELYAHWDELQRYMDVSQPLPDIPAMEAYRHLDPTTAEYDAAGKRGCPVDYWKTLDLEWWEKEGYPAHMEKIRNFPWESLEDQMQYSVDNLNKAAMA